MKAQVTDRNTQIVNAYIAGNHNKSELARYFGVSASTIRRVLAAVVVATVTATAAAPAAAADSNSLVFLNDVNELGTNNQYVLNSWEKLSYEEQQDVFAAKPFLKQELKAPVKAAAHIPEVEVDPVEDVITLPTAIVKLPANTMEPSVVKESNPEGKPTNQIAPASHLDAPEIDRSNHLDAPDHKALAEKAQRIAEGAHRKFLTEQANASHLDAPDIDRSNHLDSNVSQAERDHAQLQATTEHVNTLANVKNSIDGANARENIRQSDRIQGMLAAHDAAQTQAIVQASIPVVQQDSNTRLTQMNAAATNAAVHSLIAQQTADHQTIEKLTATPAQQPVVQQEVRSAYYDAQITSLNIEAEQNHAEVLSESHARYQADKQVLSESESYTNQKFSSLKSEVDDNKKEAAAGSASAMAQANIPQVQESQQFAVGAGIGGYDSENALSVGASFHAGHATIVKMTVSDDSQDNVGYGAGVSVGW